MKKPSNIIILPETGGISRIKLNEPNTYNALSYAMLKSLIDSFNFLNNQKQTKVIIIEGVGRGFSAGHNLKEIKLLTRQLVELILDTIHFQLRKIILFLFVEAYLPR